MSNKTCGECRHFEVDVVAATCEFKFWISDGKTPACKMFEPRVVTNGDVIRQMSNTYLAKMLVYPVKPVTVDGTIHYEFTSCLLLGKSYPMREQAVFLTERRLNAPAEINTEREE